MLKKVIVDGFKSFHHAEMPLSRVTFMIGANGSGKTNALEALRFMHWMGRGERLDDLETRLGSEPGQIRGSVFDLFRFGSSSFAFDIDVADGRPYAFSQRVSVITPEETHETVLVVEEEKCMVETEKLPLYAVRPDSAKPYTDEIEVEYNNFTKGCNKPRIPCSNRQAIFYQLLSSSRFERERAKREIPEAANALKKAFGQMLFLDADLGKMRGYARKTKERMLEKDASNISAVIYNLCNDQQSKAALIQIIRSLPEQDIRDISFVETSIGDVMLQLDEGPIAGRAVPVTLLSDGTLRLLAVAAGILSVPPGSLAVIEEIDNGIHPSRAQHLIDELYEIAEKRDIQILVTTHNPALMDAIPTAEVANVLCCYRDPSDGSSQIVRLGDTTHYVELMARGSLGDLATSDVLNQVLKDASSKGEVIERHREWAQTLFDLPAEGES